MHAATRTVREKLSSCGPVLSSGLEDIVILGSGIGQRTGTSSGRPVALTRTSIGKEQRNPNREGAWKEQALEGSLILQDNSIDIDMGTQVTNFPLSASNIHAEGTSALASQGLELPSLSIDPDLQDL